MMPRALFLFALVLCLPSCDQALVYGERSGLNISVRTDVAEGQPIEVNTGFQRRVIAYVPPRTRAENGLPNGEAVNMASRFDIRRVPRDETQLRDVVAIRSVFASGQAATKEANVAAVADAPVFLTPTDAGQAAVVNKLVRYIGADRANLDDYLSRATAEGLEIPNDPLAGRRALSAIHDSRNATGNARISNALNL
jgi:hypothetical protein